MNKVILLGRMTRDPEFRAGAEEKNNVTRFSIAVDRRSKDAGADFVNCVSFGKTAEVISKFFQKGSKILICGRIVTGNYINKDGVKVNTFDVNVEEFEFVDKKDSSTPVASSDAFPEEGMPWDK